MKQQVYTPHATTVPNFWVLYNISTFSLSYVTCHSKLLRKGKILCNIARSEPLGNRVMVPNWEYPQEVAPSE